MESTATQGHGAKGTALILEGGSFRGQFTAGVLDVLMEHGITADACFGVSAGALNGMNFKSRQIGRVNRVNLTFCNDSRYMGARSFAASGSIVGYDFMLNDVQDTLDPFDNETFESNPMPLYAVATDVVFGTAAYLEMKNAVLDIDMARASTSLPLVTQAVELGGNLYLDGGVADSVPVEHALEQAGFDRAIMVLTRERSYEKGPYDLLPAARAAYAGYPYLVDALATRHTRYNEQREHIWEYERQGRALVIAPERPVEVGHIEHDPAKLLDLYIQGRQQATRQLEAIRSFARSSHGPMN